VNRYIFIIVVVNISILEFIIGNCWYD